MSLKKPTLVLIGGITALFAAQYLVAEFITASAWTNPGGYSWTDNYISDLGVPECFTVEQVGRVVCSPLSELMNTAFVLQSVILLSATALLWPLIPRAARIFAVPLIVIHAVGIAIVGLFPGSIAENIGANELRMMMHSIGAGMAILGGNLLMITAALTTLKIYPKYAAVSALLGALGLAGTLLFTTDMTLGLGIGGMERVAVNPTVLWIVFTGLIVLAARQYNHVSTK